MGKNAQILQNLSSRIKSIGAEKSPILEPVRSAIQNLVSSGFNTSTSPEGKAFAPLKDKSGRKPIIEFRDSLSYQQQGNSILASTSKSYLTYHQTGTKKIEQRNPFPIQKMPDTWLKTIYQAALAGIYRRLDGRRS